MSRLLLFNLATDADDPVFGFTTVWINALAAHYDAVDVLTMRAGRLALAENVSVYSVGKERGFSETRRAANFYRILPRLLRQHTYAACFAHMQPLFALMAAPLLKPRRIPITLWYAHKSVTPRLRLAEKLVDHVVTASPESFRINSKKVRITGHGIDTDAFAPASPAPFSHKGDASQEEKSGFKSPRPLWERGFRGEGQPFTIISAGRITPVKRLEELIEAAALLAQNPHFPPFVVRLYGSGDAGYIRRLRERGAPCEALIDFAGPVTYTQMPAIYRGADVMVNLSATGSVDKAVLEAMACGVPVITSNEAFSDILRPWADTLLTPPNRTGILAQRLQAVAALPPDDRRALGHDLRQIVLEGHSLTRLVHLLVSDVLEG